MKRKYIIWILLLVIAGAAGYFYLHSRNKKEIVTIQTIHPDYGFIASSITATGNIEPDDTVSVGAQVSGVVKDIYVDFNSIVTKGQLIAKIDPAITSAQVEQSRAALANAESNLEFQKNTFERQNQLFNLGAISKADYQLSTNQYNIAKAAVDNSRAALKLSERNLYYTNIYSPINGLVLNRNVSAGQTIAASFNAPTLFVIAKDLTRMQVNANVDEADIGGIVKGLPVTFTVDAFPNDVFRGKVEDIYLHPSVSANVVTYTTLISVDNKDMKLKPGMTASINIYTEEDSNALLIPSRAISFKPDSTVLSSYHLVRKSAGHPGSQEPANEDDSRSATVWVKQGDSLLQKNILVGLNDDTHVKVIQGLSKSDEVVIGVSTGSKAIASASDKSPFMPQMGRRQSSTPRN